MKKILFFAVGLMSLLGGLLSSCDDKSSFIEEEEFAPYGFFVKDAENIKIVGFKGLVIEDMAKSDWQLFVPFDVPFIGTEPLLLTRYEFLITSTKFTEQVDIETNMQPIGNEEQEIPFAVGGISQSYTYMGEKLDLSCLSSLKVIVKVVKEETSENPYFMEKGYLDFSFVANDTICLVQKEVPYTVAPAEYYRDYSNNK